MNDKPLYILLAKNKRNWTSSLVWDSSNPSYNYATTRSDKLLALLVMYKKLLEDKNMDTIDDLNDIPIIERIEGR